MSFRRVPVSTSVAIRIIKFAVNVARNLPRHQAKNAPDTSGTSKNPSQPLAFTCPARTTGTMRPRPLLILPLLLLATPALAARTATISGAPSAHASPDANAAVTGHPPTGATVTVERCTSDATQDTATAPGTDDWCLLRSVGWVMGQGLVNLSADPAALLPDDAGFDPLKPTTPAWDDLESPPDQVPAQPSF